MRGLRVGRTMSECPATAKLLMLCHARPQQQGAWVSRLGHRCLSTSINTAVATASAGFVLVEVTSNLNPQLTALVPSQT